MRRSPTLLLALALLAAPALAPASTADAPAPDGANAIRELVTFATAHPLRHGEGVTMQLARDYLADKLDAYGYDVERQTYTGGTNIVGLLPGTARPHDWVTLSAHYDTVNIATGGFGLTFSGAWDNGAGVAAVLELARVIAMRSWENTVAIAFFDDEESGLVGSHRYVQANDGRAWEGGTVRLVANLNTDPPGLNWPCVVDGAALPVTFYEAHTTGVGQAEIRSYALAAKDAAGVPANAFQFFHGSVSVGILAGNSDNWRFAQKGIPEMYVGSSTHLLLGTGQTVPTMYPLHTPADNVATMFAFCAPPLMEIAFEVEMGILLGILERIDAHGGPFPRP